MVGMDGVVGASAALAARYRSAAGIIQLAGDAIRVRYRRAEIHCVQSPRLLSLLIRHEQTVYAQAQQSAACFATASGWRPGCAAAAARQGPVRRDHLPFTQEYLGKCSA